MTDLDRAKMLLELDRGAQAREVLGRVLSTDPENPEALCLLAQAALAEDDGAGALTAAQQATRAAPYSDWPWRLLALALVRARYYDEAVEAARTAVQLDPHDWRTHITAAQVDIAARRVDAATVATAREAVRLAPHEADCHRILGNALYERHRRRAAHAALLEAARLDPNDAAVRNDLARVQLRRLRVGRAAVGFADAAALDPTDDIAARNLVALGGVALAVVHGVLWAALVLPALIVSGGERQPARPIVWLCFGLVSVAVVVFGVLVWRRTRPRTRRLVAVVARRDRLLVVWAGCLAVSYAMYFADALFGPSTGWFGGVFAALAAGAVTSWVRAHRLKR